jgi:hypothetical protein
MKKSSIVILKSGEKLITILQEAFEGEGEEKRGICLVMTRPYELSLAKVENIENPEQDLQVKFSKWCPYSIDTDFKIAYDGVLTIGEPDPGLAQAYQAKIEQAIEAEGGGSPETNSNYELQQEEIRKVINPEVV